MTPAAIMAIPADILRTGDSLNERGRQHIRLSRYFEQRGHRPSWAEIEAERARRTPTTSTRLSEPDNRKART